jgi:hypothetical protein
MGCCGQNRRMWQSPPRRSLPSETSRPPMLTAAVGLEYRGDTSIVVAGPVTGFTYVFPKAGEHLEVDGRDAPELLSSGDFVLASHA